MWLKILETIITFLTFAVPTIFVIYAYTSSGFVWQNSLYSAAGSKNHMFIWTVGITILIVIGMFAIILKLLLKSLAGKTINERIDEGLFIENDILTYGYRLKMQSYRSERVLVTIPLNDCRYSIDKTKKEIKFTGKIFSQFYTDYSKNEINGKGDYINEFILYDYFSPSLINFLDEWRS